MAHAKFSETMIGAKDLVVTKNFYVNFLGMQIADPGDGKSFLILEDLSTKQRLLIVADPTIQNALPSIESVDIESTLVALSSHGGVILDRKQYPTMKLANVQDSDGRKMCIWQTL